MPIRVDLSPHPPQPTATGGGASRSSQNPQGLYWPRLRLQRSKGPEHTEAAMCRSKECNYVRRLYEPHAACHLRTHPGELHSRIVDPSPAHVLTLLQDRLLTFFLETRDLVPFNTGSRW